jgi:hypothetical protein
MPGKLSLHFKIVVNGKTSEGISEIERKADLNG